MAGENEAIKDVGQEELEKELGSILPAGGANSEETKDPEKETKEEKTPEEIEAERITAEDKAKKDAEDPEFDLGLDVDGKTPLKLTKSQILALKKGGMLQEDYTKKTQELAAEKQNLKEVVEIIEFLKKNPKKAEKIVAILEEKAEEATKEGKELENKVDEIDELLKDLPEDDPYAKGLRALKAQLGQALNVNKQLQDRLSQFEEKTTAADESKIQAEADQTLQEVIASTQKSLQFIDAEEGEFWKKQVLTYLVNSPQEYAAMDKAQFEEYFKKIGQSVYDMMKKIGEKHVGKYIKSKKGGPEVITEAGGKGGILPAAPNAENLQGSLEKLLEEEENKS